MGISASGIDPGSAKAGQQYTAERKRQKRLEQLATPETFGAYADYFFPRFKQLAAPSADAAALGEQSDLQSLASNMAGRGLTGSGADYWLQQGIRGGRQARLASIYTEILRAALEQAGRSQGLGIQALLGTPIPQPVSSTTRLWNPTGATSASVSLGGMFGG